MKAGDALGLLAGLGALNALGGGRNGTGKRFTGLMDMLDGGGAGASGDRFEGGGLLSILGNLFAKPLEAQRRVEDISARTSTNNAVVDVLKDMAKGGTPTSRLDGKDFPMQYSGRGNMGMPRSGMEYSGRGLLAGSPEEMQYSGRGEVGMPKEPLQYSGRGNVGMNDRTGMLYSGRGEAGMPAQPEMVYSGRGISAGGFSPNLYASMIDDLRKVDPDFVENADSATLMDMYSTYVQNAGSLY